MTRPAWRWIRRGVVVIGAFAILDYLVLPQIAGTRKALDLLSTIRPWWVITAVGLEVASLACYSRLTSTLLPDNRPPYSWLFRTDVTALGVSHLLPGGAATSSALRYRLLRQGGVPAEDVAVAMAIEGVGSNLVLAAITWLALVASIPFFGLHSLYLPAAIIGAILIAATSVTITVRTRHPTHTSGPSVLQRGIRRLPQRFRPRIERAVREASEQVHQLLANRRELRVSAAWAAANLVLDAASLWVFLAAYGDRVNPDGLLVAYGIANVVAILPISPGGLGIIEAVIIPALVGFGTPRAVAVLGVISWRLFNFWAPIPAAGACFLSLRTQEHKPVED